MRRSLLLTLFGFATIAYRNLGRAFHIDPTVIRRERMHRETFHGKFVGDNQSEKTLGRGGGCG